MFPSASDESIKKFFEIIQRRIDQLITMDSLTDASSSKIGTYVAFKERHCVSTSYMFQIMKCRDVEYVVCSPLHLPDEIFEELHFIPAPLLDALKEHFQKFSAVYGSKTTVKDMLSLKFTLEASVEDKENKSILVLHKV